MIRISICDMAAGDRALARMATPYRAQDQDGRRLAGVIGGLPVPGAGRIGGTEGGLRRAAQNGGIDAPAAFEIGQKLPRSLHDGGARLRVAHIESGAALAPLRRVSVMGGSRRAGKGRTARRSPEPPRLKPFPAPLFLLSPRQ